MFLALRDLRYAKGRFVLIGGVIALITLLVVMLTGLSAGLARESISSIDGLSEQGVERVAFSQPASGQKVGYESSSMTQRDLQELEKQGVQASPLSIANANAHVGRKSAAVSVFAVPAGSFATPPGVAAGHVVIGSGLAKALGVKVGDSISLGTTNVVVRRVSDAASYQHTPVVWISQKDAESAGLVRSGHANVALLSGRNAKAVAAKAGLVSMTPQESFSAVTSYQAETDSLTLIRVMLLLVSALVVGAFFTVWTIQRTPDLAVLKAIGAKTSSLIRDALGQATLLLLVGGGAGAALAAVGGYFARRSVPFVVDVTTTLVPLALLFVLGLVGAALSVRRIVTVDPLTALGSTR